VTGETQGSNTLLEVVKPRPHQQQCRSDVRIRRSNAPLCRKNRSTCSIRQCRFDIVAGVDRALRSRAPTSRSQLRRPITCATAPLHDGMRNVEFRPVKSPKDTFDHIRAITGCGKETAMFWTDGVEHSNRPEEMVEVVKAVTLS